MCWNRSAGQERRPLTKETATPKHFSFLHPTDHSTHLGTHLSHTPPFNPPTTSQAEGISDQQSSVGANPFARSFTIQLFVYCMLLFIIINQTSSFTTLTFVPSDFVTTHSFWFPQHLPISRRFCAGFPTLSLTFYFLPS